MLFLCVPSGAVAGVGVMVWVLGGCVGAAGALASADDCCSVSQCVKVCCGVLGCAAVWFNVLQCVEVC